VTIPETLTRRRRLVVVVLVVAVVVAVSVPWLLREHGSPGRAAPLTPVAADLRVAERIGGAERLVAKRHSTGVAARPSDVQAAADADKALAVDLLQRLQTTSGENLSVSPMSLALALTMVQNGARGQTLAGIKAALHTGDLGGLPLDAGWSALVAEWQAAAKTGGFALQSANSLWLSPHLRTRPGFMSALASYFDSGVWRVDFTKPAANDAINKWTSEQTHGRITKLFEHLDPETLAVLANAVYFKAAWQEPFDPSDTHAGTFTAGNGKPAPASFMSQSGDLSTAVTDTIKAVQLPYKGGRFAALAIMPTSSSLNDYVEGLAGAALDDVVAGLRAGPAKVTVPKFTTTSTLDLKDPLRAMGMADAFTDGADFSALSPTRLKINQVVQRVYLKVGEKGTEAAAATGVGMTATGAQERPPVSITLDHPFLFLIRDTKIGAILFASEIQHPKN
jgi:serpin B